MQLLYVCGKELVSTQALSLLQARAATIQEGCEAINNVKKAVAGHEHGQDEQRK